MPIIDFDSDCWADPWVQSLRPLEKLLFIYLWTNVHRNISGFYMITEDTISFETRLTKNQVHDLLKKLFPKVQYDFDRSICWVVKHARRQFLRGGKISSKQREGIRRHVLKLRWHSFFKSFIEVYPEIFLEEEKDTLSRGIDRVSIPFDTLGGGGKGNSLKERGGVGEKTRFEIFWKAYPLKKSKGQAEKAWAKIKPDEQLLAKMIATIERAKKSVEWTKIGPLGIKGEFIPYPATWLNAKGWEDEFMVSQNASPEYKDPCPTCEDFKNDRCEIGQMPSKTTSPPCIFKKEKLKKPIND